LQAVIKLMLPAIVLGHLAVEGSNVHNYARCRMKR